MLGPPEECQEHGLANLGRTIAALFARQTYQDFVLGAGFFAPEGGEYLSE